MSRDDLPDSAALALWFSAWTSGWVSLDDARDAVVGRDAEHHVTGLPGEPDPVPMILAFGRLRAVGGSGGSGAGIALPVPGDPLGLAGPAAFNADALEVGEAAVLSSADVGLVPRRTGAGVVWTCHEAVARRQVPDPAEADTGLRQAVVAAADALAALDVAAWRPEVADALMSLRETADLRLPKAMAPRAQRLAALSLRCRRIVDLALVDEGGAVTVAEERRRRDALAPLDHAARRGLVAACAFPFQR